jgi:outer membrane protein assembly factor BamB
MGLFFTTILPTVSPHLNQPSLSMYLPHLFLYDTNHDGTNDNQRKNINQISLRANNDLPRSNRLIFSNEFFWPVMAHDVRHTGKSNVNTTDCPLVEKWHFPGDSWVFGSPVIDSNGTIYFGADDFYAIYSNGTQKWKVNNKMDVFSAPAIDRNGNIYTGTFLDSPNYLFAFYPNGTVKWRYPTSNIFSSPVIDSNNIIYFGEDNGNLLALYPNGTLKWSSPNIYSVYSSPAIGDDGTIYCTSWYGNVYAIYPNNGTIKWQFPTGGQMKANPSIADDGTIYASSWDDYLYALYPNNGTMKWRVNTYLGSSSNPSIGPDGTIYVAHTSLYAVNPDGTMKWVFPFGTDRHCSFAAPAISADGLIYVGVNIGEGSGGELVVVNPDGTERWRSGNICNEGITSSPAIGADGTVYIGTLNDEEVHSGAFTSKGFLHAFGPGEIKKATLDQPAPGQLYFFGTPVLPPIFKKTLIIGNVTVQASVTNVEELDHIGFFVDGNIQYNCTEPPFEWTMNKNYFDGLIEYHRIRVTAFYKGGCEWSEQCPVTYIHFRRN